MLKYKLNTNNFFNNDNALKVEECNISQLLGEIGENYDMVTCFCNDISNMYVGQKLLSLNVINVIEEKYTELNNQYNFTNTVDVSGVNVEQNCFTFLIEKEIELDIKVISYQNPYVNGVKDKSYRYVYFYFNNSHYFSNDEIVSDQEIVLKISFFNTNGVLKVVEVPCEYVTLTILRVNLNGILEDDDYKEMLIVLFGQNYEDLSSDTIGKKENVTVFRKNFLYKNISDFKLYFDKPLQTFVIPISQKFETNMYQSDAIQTNFVDYEKKKAINKITDMEKDVYHPVIWDSENKKKVQDVYQIEFNLHFREHRGENWTVDPNSYWNGTYINDEGDLSLMKTSENEDYGYFSYGNKTWDASNQSDLLSYLNFTNEDVRYQKNKVKKSFLRLSFYDSTNPANQNLLYYSTIFIDSGILFTKYIKHIEDEKYSMITYDSDNYFYDGTRQNLVGVRVNREPMLNSKIWTEYQDDVEEIRLSTQLVIKDKFNSSSSCEGFYIYLWRDNDNGVIPSDLYMKVEFNHAGYGRTIPFMMPYFKGNKNNGGKVKTFQEIIDDWQPNDSDGNPKMGGIDVGYGIRKYLNYSYVHLKYQYDKVNKQHIYYVDDEFYDDLETSIYDENKPNTIKFNLYEAKISAGSNTQDASK